MSSQDLGLATTEELIAEAKAGRMFILMDDENRENEGDLVIPAEKADADAINFMVKYGRGLVCLTLTRERVEQLRLPLMAQSNRSRTQTAFTVSIEAREGVTTGISAGDRARTVAAAIDPALGPEGVVSPGHIFPLVARDGGVLVRAGHTEAAVDIARLAGCNPSGVICEVMKDDGSMARLPDLIPFAKEHGLKIGTIADLIAYRRRSEKLVERLYETSFDSVHGGAFKLAVYVNRVSYAEHVALVRGDLTAPGPVLVRMHAVNVLDDVLGDVRGGGGSDLHLAMRRIAAADRGVIVLLREPHPTALSDRLRSRAGDAAAPEALRDYGVGAQILLDLGVRDMVLLSNHKRTIVGLDGYGLTVVGQEPIASEGA